MSRQFTRLIAAKPINETGPRLGVATLYNGVAYRSRIEARWAAMFDALGWSHEYEPLDLNGYLPDYTLAFERAVVLGEVKHAVEPHRLEQAAHKVARSGWGGDFVMLGATLFAPASHPGRISIGLMGQREPGPDGEHYYDIGHALVHWCKACEKVSFHHSEGAWRCVRCRASDGNRLIDPVDPRWVRQQWAAACNRVQWKGVAL